MVNIVAATPSVNNHSYSNELTKYEAMEIYIFAVFVAYLVGACANLFPWLDRQFVSPALRLSRRFYQHVPTAFLGKA